MKTSRNTTETRQNKPQHNEITVAQHNRNKLQHNEISTMQQKQVTTQRN